MATNDRDNYALIYLSGRKIEVDLEPSHERDEARRAAYVRRTIRDLNTITHLSYTKAVAIHHILSSLINEPEYDK